jgi:hypothetical protein
MKDYIEGRGFYINEDNKFDLAVVDGTGTITITIKPENFGEVRKPPVFGVSLRTLLDRDDSNQPIPTVVRHCCQALYKSSKKKQTYFCLLVHSHTFPIRTLRRRYFPFIWSPRTRKIIAAHVRY